MNRLRQVPSLVWGGFLLVAILAAILYLRTQSAVDGPVPALPAYGALDDFRLTNQFGEPFGLVDLRGNVWLADIIFTRCPGPCPELTRTMREIEDRLPAESGARLVSLTADPKFDTPAMLQRYAARMGADSARWAFLTGDKEDVYRLAREGLKFVTMENDDPAGQARGDLFIHSTRIVLVDGDGQVRGYFDGLESGTVSKIVAAVQALERVAAGK